MNIISKLMQVLAFVPTVVNSVESLLSHRSGDDKRDAVVSFLQTALSMTDAVAGKEIVDEARFKTGLSEIISGTVTCLNASIWAKPQAAQTPASNQ